MLTSPSWSPVKAKLHGLIACHSVSGASLRPASAGLIWNGRAVSLAWLAMTRLLSVCARYTALCAAAEAARRAGAAAGPQSRLARAARRDRLARMPIVRPLLRLAAAVSA